MAGSSTTHFSNVSVFCGSGLGSDKEYEIMAKRLGEVLAKKNIHLIYGGGNHGLIVCVSKVAYDGVIPKLLLETGAVRDSIGEVEDVTTMHGEKLE